jgi:shikimate kinase
MSEKAFCGGRSRCAEITAALGTRAVVLVGIMGAGKSSIGRRLSARLRLPFLDADTEIERAHAMTIPEIFASYGEQHFRDGEVGAIARLLENGPSVLATGGGADFDGVKCIALAALERKPLPCQAA